MLEPLVITIDGAPVAWQRATPVMVGDYVVPKTPKATRIYQSAIRGIASLEMRGRQKFTGPIRMTVTAYLKRPAIAVKEDRRFPHKQGTGDADNYSKSAQDALNGIAYVDDAQICDLVSYKRYGSPSLHIVIEELEETAADAVELALSELDYSLRQEGD